MLILFEFITKPSYQEEFFALLNTFNGSNSVGADEALKYLPLCFSIGVAETELARLYV